MTKAITSVSIMMLVEEGRIGLDDSVSKYIPEFADLKVFVAQNGEHIEVEDAKREMSIRDLLRHTSGLTYGFFGNTPIDRKYRAAKILADGDTLKEMSAKLSKIPLLHQPGSQFNYSASTDVLGDIIERVSGQRLSDFFQQRILGPLGMKDTAFYVPTGKTHRFVNNYGPKLIGDGLRVIDKAADSNYLKVPTADSGGGGIVSTAGDYIYFCQMLLNMGQLNGTRLLKESTVEQMTRNQLSEGGYPINLNGPASRSWVWARFLGHRRKNSVHKKRTRRRVRLGRRGEYPLLDFANKRTRCRRVDTTHALLVFNRGHGKTANLWGDNEVAGYCLCCVRACRSWGDVVDSHACNHCCSFLLTSFVPPVLG